MKRKKERPLPRETGRAHRWFNPRSAGYVHLGDYESCADCGVCKNARNETATTCKGVVRVTLRAAPCCEHECADMATHFARTGSIP